VNPWPFWVPTSTWRAWPWIAPRYPGGVDPELQNYLDGAPNVTQDGSIPPASTLPNNGFFEQNNVIGADVDSWKGAWVFGL